MFTVVVQEKGGKSQRLQFNKGEITIGRVQGNDIVLPKGNVSKRHSKIVFKEGKFIVVDLKSTNGTYVNGHKIASPQVIKGTDKVFVGDFVIEIEDGANGEAASPPGPGPGMPPGPPGPGPGMPPGPGPGMPPGPGPGGPPPMGARPPMPGPMTGPQPPMPGGPGGPGGPGMPPGPPGGPPPMGVRPPMPPTGPGMPPGPPGPGPGPGPGGPPPMGARPPMPGPGPGGPPPMSMQQPQGRAGAWNEVSPQGGPSYHYLSVQGGWLISSSSGLVFVPDVQHQHPPIPS